MAESGFFRVGFRGFKKQDVLQYIDEMQSAHGARLAESEELRLQAQELLTDAQQEASQAKARAEELETKTAELSEQVEKLTALAQIYKTELLELREEKTAFEQAQADTSKLDEALAEIAALKEQCTLLKEQNARYAAVVGDVSRLVMEARVVSASYLDAAHQKSTECIRQLDSFLTELKGQAEKALVGADANRRAGNDHIETLLSDLQGLGDTLPDSAAEA